MKGEVKYCIDVMSGTALDGVDICYVRFENNDRYNFEILNAITYKYPDKWKSELENAFTFDTKSFNKKGFCIVGR